jgi:hydroxymethylglutaryl-CoA reductase (NADPH)
MRAMTSRWISDVPPKIVGTGLPTHRERLEMLGYYGAGKVNTFAEICAGVALAGDISLTSAILAGDWVTSHDALGRNR